MVPVLADSLSPGGWFGNAPTLIGVALLAFWGVVRWRGQPAVDRLQYRVIGTLFLVVSLSLWLGFDRPEGATEGHGGAFGAFFAEGFHSPLLRTFGVILVGLATLISIPLATDWLFLPMFLRFRAARGLAAAPVIGAVGGYQIRGAYAHEVGTEAPPAPTGLGSPTASDESDATGAADQDEEAEDDEPTATATEAEPGTHEREDEEEEARRAFMRANTAAATRVDDEDLAPRETAEPAAAEDDANVPWYARRRRARAYEARERAPEPEPTHDDEEPELESEPASYARAAEPEPGAPEHESAAEPEEPAAPASPSLDDALSFMDEAEATPTPPTREIEEEQPEPAAPAAQTNALEREFDEAFAAFEEPAPKREPPAQPQTEAPTESQLDDALSFLNEEAPSQNPPAAERAEDEASPTQALEPEPEQEPERELDQEEESAFQEPAPALSEEDRLYQRAGDAVVQSGKASIAFLQKTLGIGYFQAAKLLDRLERERVIGPYTGGVNRDVLIDAKEWNAAGGRG